MYLQSLVLVTVLVTIQNTNANRTVTSFPIGGLFNRNSLLRSFQAFEGKAQQSKTKTYHGRSLYSKVIDSYSTSIELCEQTENNSTSALIDGRPTNGICDTICLICNALNIPRLVLGWEHPPSSDKDEYSFYYHPHPETISKAYAALIKHLGWDKFTILYEDDGSFKRLHEVINSWSVKAPPIIFKKLDPNGDNRETFKYIFKVARMSYHVIDCDVDNIPKYMQQIVDVENSTEYQSFILSNLDAYRLDFKNITDLMANVSTLHLTRVAQDAWQAIGMAGDGKESLETALTADALTHVERAIQNMNQQGLVTVPSLCQKELQEKYEDLAWPLGSRLRDALYATPAKGFTGDIAFENGKRVNFTLLYSKLHKNSTFMYTGDWDYKTNKINEKTTVVDRSTATKDNSIIRVATTETAPYFQLVHNGTHTYPEGYAVDLINAIFGHIKNTSGEHFVAEFYPVEGGSGNKQKGTNKWNGIIGELLDHKAHLGITDLTITSDRNEVVDFSIPFMALGISMLYQVLEPPPPDWFSFINPLSLDVWLYLATTYIIVSFILFICARMSQDDWVNPHPCNQNPENLENIWSFYNCLWLTMGTIMTQGCDILPRAPGSRWIAGMWFFFALIVTASYMANMSAFLSNDRRSYEIKDVEDLLKQNKITYGSVVNGSTYKFFQNSNDTIYSKIWDTMESAKPKPYVKNNEEGVERVKHSKEKYAFFMESTSIEYYIKRNCRLYMLGSKLDSKEYGIAMAKNYPHRNKVDAAILFLQEQGHLEILKKTWWEDKNPSPGDCKKDTTQEENGLKMDNTSGIFLVLGSGGLLGVIVAIIDFMLHAREISAKEKVTFKEALLSEWRASLNPRELHRLAAPPRSAPPSTASPSPDRERSQSRAVSVLRAAGSFINFDAIY